MYVLDSKMLRSIISLLYCFGIINANTNDQFLTPIQFPLRNIKSSINIESESSFNVFTSEFHQYNSHGYVLNLPKLNLQWPPNPYPGFIESSKVVAINLQENGIYRIAPGSFDSVPNVQYLDLSRNRLSFCDFFNYGSCLQNLVTLVIEENRLPGDSLDHDISKAGCFPQLRHLYIRKDRIRRLKFSLRQSFPNLVSLHLSDNEIDTCAFLRDIPSTLTHLHIERNRISTISSTIVRNLKTLNADGNIIGSICYKNCRETSLKLLGTTKLEVLSLAENKITQIEACAFRDTYSLTSLNLSSNSIETVHSSTFTSLRALAQLYLDNNLLVSMPNLNGNWYLKTLSLRNNKLTVIRRESFSNVKTLQRLLLGGNRIQNIQCNTFADLTWLQELDLSNNELESLPSGWMRGLVNLKYIDLRSNRFTYVYQLSLSTSISLSTIYLQNNKITQNHKNEIQKYCPYAQVYLDSCNFSCSSSILI